MDILQKPDALCFATALKEIVIRSDTTVKAVFDCGGHTLLQETYSPDSENRIYIRDLKKLFLPYIPKTTLRNDFSIRLTPEGGSAVDINTTVLYALTDIDIPAADFLENSFLTLLQNEKNTYPEQKEFLSLFTAQQTNVSAIARYACERSETRNLTINTPNRVITLDVSPAELFPDPTQILYYSILAANRTFTFYIKPKTPREYSQILFLNSFGVKETFIPAAITQRENKSENRFVNFGGKYRKYDVELTKEHTANTGILTGKMADWIEDLFISRLLSPDDTEKEIVITEAQVKRSTAADELPAFEFKYRHAENGSNTYSLQENRIFDNTYNFSFN
jgi:hypothetical protein